MKLEDFGKAKKLVTKLNKLKAQLELWSNAKGLVDTKVRANIENPKSRSNTIEYIDLGTMNFEILQGYMISVLEDKIKKYTEEFESI